LRRLAWNPKLRITFKSIGYFLCGMIFSGASLLNMPLPLPLCVLCATGGGWPALLISLGSGLGYWLFWGSAGAQGLVWAGAGLVISLALGGRRPTIQLPLLMPSLAAFSVAFTGLLFQILYKVDATPFLMYLLRVALAFGATMVFAKLRERRDPVTEWLAGGLAILALAQVSPLASFNFGFVFSHSTIKCRFEVLIFQLIETESSVRSSRFYKEWILLSLFATHCEC
jgi:hypothetical protein